MALALRELFASFNVEFDKKRELEKGNKQVDKTKKGLGGLDKAAKSTTGALKGLVTAIGGTAAIAAFSRMISSTVESTNEIGRWSARLGISERDMHNWSATASLFGADVEDVADAFKELQIKSRDALSGGGTAGDAWKMLGVDVKSLEPIMGDQVALMEAFTTALAGANEETQNFVVDDIMSDAGTRLLPMFRQGTQEIRRMNREAEAMGGETFPELAAQTREYMMAQRRLDRSWTASRNALVSRVLPALTDLIDKGKEIIDWMKEAAEKSYILEAAMIVLGGVAAGAAVAAAVAWGAALWPIIAIGVAVGVLIAVIDDLYTTTASDDSETMTRTFLEWAFGAEQATRMINNVRQAIIDLRGAVGSAGAWLFGGREVDEETGMTSMGSLAGLATRGFEEVFDSGIGEERLAERRWRERNRTQQERVQQERAGDPWSLENILDPVMVPGTVGEELAQAESRSFQGEQSVPSQFRTERRQERQRSRRETQERAQRERAAQRETRQRIREAPRQLATSTQSIVIEPQVSLTFGDINEASDEAQVRRVVEEGVRSGMNESFGEMARELETLTGGADDLIDLGVDP